MRRKSWRGSPRNSRRTREADQVGAHIPRLPFAVIEELLSHNLTMEGMKLFAEDVVPEYADLLKS